MDVELKAVKTAKHLSQETIAYSASIYVDGKRIGIVSNSGTGGGNQYDWLNQKAAKVGLRLQIWAKDQKTEFEYDKLDQIINDLADEFEERQAMRRKCKTHIMFRLKGDSEDEWRTIKAPYDDRAKAHMQKKYGDRIEVIANDTP